MALFDKFTKKNEAPTLIPSDVLPTILEALSREGYRPERDNEIRIVYKNEGVFCCFYYREDDPEFLLVRATFERAAFDDVHEAFLYKACAKTDFDQKVSKAYVDEDGDIVFSVESFIMAGTPIDALALRLPWPSFTAHSSSSSKTTSKRAMMTRILAPPYFHRVDSPAKTCSHQGDKVGKTSYRNSTSPS